MHLYLDTGQSLQNLMLASQHSVLLPSQPMQTHSSCDIRLIHVKFDIRERHGKVSALVASHLQEFTSTRHWQTQGNAQNHSLQL